MTYANMQAEFKREGITQRQVAKSMGMSENNLSMKLNEKVPMTVDEAKFINSKFLPRVKLDYLLESDGDKPTKAESLHAQVDAMGDEMRRAKPGDGEVAEIEGAFHECVDEWERQYPEKAVETA